MFGAMHPVKEVSLEPRFNYSVSVSLELFQEVSDLDMALNKCIFSSRLNLHNSAFDCRKVGSILCKRNNVALSLIWI